ncbi:MAG: rod-binding protein [Alphaproteobacteria bacterium]|nr:rod-binding protein [Alphaproteobacteria bacterium]
MASGVNIAGAAMTAYANQPLTTGRGFGNDAAISKAASEFEGVFISQFLGAMFSGIKTDGPFGGGQGEEMFRSMMIDKYADGLVQQGGFGLAQSIKAQMLKMQEARP